MCEKCKKRVASTVGSTIASTKTVKKPSVKGGVLPKKPKKKGKNQRLRGCFTMFSKQNRPLENY